MTRKLGMAHCAHLQRIYKKFSQSTKNTKAVRMPLELSTKPALHVYCLNDESLIFEFQE